MIRDSEADVVAAHEFLKAHPQVDPDRIAADVQSTTRLVEILYLPGDEHATRILNSRPDVAERVAAWLATML